MYARKQRVQSGVRNNRAVASHDFDFAKNRTIDQYSETGYPMLSSPPDEALQTISSRYSYSKAGNATIAKKLGHSKEHMSFTTTFTRPQTAG